MAQADPSLIRFREVVAGATAHLDSRRQEINDLNVFPVADGDTGDNMALTLHAVVDELDSIIASDYRSLDEIGREKLVQALAQAALLGARGNSGVILSQLLRGAAEELIARPGELIRPPLVAAAFAGAARRGYESVRQPVEGTILTVVREMSAAATHAVAALPVVELAALNDEDQFAALAAVILEALAAGQRALDEGPELLPVLKEAGVVDAGGFGVLVLFAGVVRMLLAGSPGAAFDIRSYEGAQVDVSAHDSETFRFCTNFAVTGSAMRADAARSELAKLGDSILVVVGEANTLKVHVHTDDPDAAMALFGDGEVSRTDVADMHEQVAARVKRSADAGVHADERSAETSAPAATAPKASAAPPSPAREVTQSRVLAIASGAGIIELLQSLEIEVLDGGSSMNPSTAEILEAINQAPGREIVLLPNDSNIFMAAEAAAKLADKPVAIVKTRHQLQALSAVLEHDPDASAEETAAAIGWGIGEVRCGGVARSARNDTEGRFKIGDAIGYIESELVAWGEPKDVLEKVIAALAVDTEILTVATADNAPLPDSEVAELVPDGPDLELRYGGQPAWWWLISAE